ncbi:MAG: histidine kinase [Rhodoferax sp.]|nr:histidine kinase [Rhodoferax sp.]MDP3655189.1 histidine kinase [Rhodoferax sp.]
MVTPGENPPRKAHSALVTLERCIQAAVLNTVIALGLTAFGEKEFGTNLVYSQCIGLSIWALLDGGHRLLMPDRRAHWRRLFWFVPVGATLGYVLGTLVANTLLNTHNSVTFWVSEPRKAFGFLVLSLVAGGGCTYYFMSREQLATAREDMAHADAQAQAAQRHAAESQLKLLQTQLEPHMLFNTLANLRVLIGLDPTRAQDMLDRLVAYLRATLDASRATRHSLQAEFDRLHDYLELMAVRMGPRLHYTLDLPPELATRQVPPLLLQALVENSIKHGLEPKVEGGTITISARQAHGRLTLEVADTGVGSPRDLNLPPPNHSSFGLAQVRERLHTCFGDQGAINFIAGCAGGTRASITFPLET